MWETKPAPKLLCQTIVTQNDEVYIEISYKKSFRLCKYPWLFEFFPQIGVLTAKDLNLAEPGCVKIHDDTIVRIEYLDPNSICHRRT